MAKAVFPDLNRKTVPTTGPVVFKSHPNQSKLKMAKLITGTLVARVFNSLFASVAKVSLKIAACVA